MRRRLREASVGLSIIATAIAASGFWLWLRGNVHTGNNWEITVLFQDVGGLVPRSNVTYRGVDIGTVQAIVPGSRDVSVQARLSDPDLVIVQPVVAEVVTGSLLGGTASLVIRGSSSPLATAVSPTAPDCNPQQQLCRDAVVTGKTSAKLDDVIAGATDLLDQAKDVELLVSVDEMAETIADVGIELAETMDDVRSLVGSLQSTAGSFQNAIDSFQNSLDQLQPSIENANTATEHLANFAIGLDNPEAIQQLMQTFVNLQHLTAKMNEVSGDLSTLTSSTDFLRSVRDVAVGLGLFFDDIYGRERLSRPYDDTGASTEASDDSAL